MSANDNAAVSAQDNLVDMTLDYFSTRGIAHETFLNAGISAVANARNEIDHQFQPRPAIIFPYRTLEGEPDWVEIDGNQLQFFRVRYLRDSAAKSSIVRKASRFQQLKDSGVHVYLPPCFDWLTIAADPSTCIVLTEGEAKALSLAERGIPAMGLGGVDSIWRKIDDQHRELHPTLAAFKWGGRETAIVFDSDIAEKPTVQKAEERLIEQLTLRSACVRPVRLPGGAR